MYGMCTEVTDNSRISTKPSRPRLYIDIAVTLTALFAPSQLPSSDLPGSQEPRPHGVPDTS
jgi:hypothetical protein